MKIGSTAMRPQGDGTEISKKLVSLLLTFVLVVALVPNVAWADSGTSSAAVIAQKDEISSSVKDVSPTAGTNGMTDVGEAVAQGEVGQSSASGGNSDYSATMAEERVSSGLSDISEDEGVSASDFVETDISTASGDGGQGDVSIFAAPATALDARSYVVIQDAQDKDSYYSRVTGTISVGAELWANVYDYVSDGVINHDEAWTYQWMSCTTKSSNMADYVLIDGQTSQNLIVTDSLAEQIAGSYLIVKVTAGGRDYYGPATWSGFSSSNIPGPVLEGGQAQLYSVSLDKASPSVGDALTATAYASSGVPVTSDVNVTYTWSASTSRYGTFIEIVSGSSPSYTVEEAQKNQYIKVEASAGPNTVYATTTDAVLAEGAVKLSGVELSNPTSLELGATLEAKAYTGSSYSPTYVKEGVTYTWKYAETTIPSYSTTWTPIEDATGATFTVSDDFYVGKCISVSANAGANTVDFGSYTDGYGRGPFKLVGAVDIYSAFLAKDGSSTYVFAVGDTVSAQAKEKDASTNIDPDKLTYQWQVSSDGVMFADVFGQTTANLVLDESYQGRYARCIISAKTGSSSYTTRATNVIAAAGSINITSVSLDKSGTLTVGDVIIATAKASSEEVTSNDRVVWSWYCGESSSNTNVKLEGATGNTLAVTDAYLGKYIEARADGGYGQRDSSAAGPVVQAGAVELYKVEVAGAAKIDSTLTATAYKNSSTPVSAGDTVSYQWQYSTTKSTSDGSFHDIEGATAKTYTIGETINGVSSLGTYLRVKATSDGSVVSTTKPYAGTTQPVDPLGPVTQAGAYELSSAKLSSSGQAMQVGNTITPTAQVQDGYLEKDVPSDAKLTYTWYVADSEAGTFQELQSGYDSADGRLVLTDDLKGRYLKLKASAISNTVSTAVYRVTGEGEYDLLRVTLNPSSGDLFTGDVIVARVQAKSLASATYGDDVTSQVSFNWSVSDSATGQFTPLAGADASTLSIPTEAAGKYLKVTVTSGSSSVEATISSQVINSDSLEGAAKRLAKSSFRPNLTYGVDANVNVAVEAKLAELGYEGIAVTTKQADINTSESKAEVGVSSAEDATNGDVTFFFLDPDEKTSYLDYSVLRQAKLTFEFSQGDETYDTDGVYTPSVSIPWNEDRVETLLEQKAESLAIGYASGDAATSVTQGLTLPYKISGKSWSTVTWESSDPSVVGIDGYGWSDYAGKVTRMGADRPITLTAIIGIVTSGGPSTTITRDFDITVTGDPQKVAADKAALEQKVEANFAYGNVAYLGTGEAVDPTAVTDDLQLPIPRTIGVDGKYYQVTYTASSDALEVNGYAGQVYQPLSGEDKAPLDITLTVTDKSNPEITASKTLSFAVLPMEQDALDRELALMEAAKTQYFKGIAKGQDVNSVTQNLQSFQKVYLDDQGKIAWAYDITSARAAGNGIVPVELEGYDPMGSAGWRLFKSSNPSVVAHENLLVTQQEYNTRVEVSSCLESEKYARYAERYPENEAFQKLAGQSVSTTFTVKGTSGAEDPYVTATCSVIGIDKDGNEQGWAAAALYTLDNGATAAELSEAMFTQVGIVANIDRSNGWYLSAVTSPFDAGQTLSWDDTTEKYWQLFINGEPALVGAGGYTLQAGDSVVWYYSAWGDSAPTEQLSVTASVIGADGDGNAQTWASTVSYAVDRGATAADLSEAMFAQTGLAHESGDGSYGWFLNTITSPYDADQTLGYSAATGKYWQLFINGKFAMVGASGYSLQAGDSITWYYGSDEVLPDQVAVTGQIIGADAGGTMQIWAPSANYTMVEGSTAADLSEQLFAQTGLSYEAMGSGSGWYLNTITSPFDGRTLGWDDATEKYWQLFINGQPASVGAGGYTLQPGDSVVWYYSAYNTPLPDSGQLVINPDAPRPSYDSAWPGFANGMGGSTIEAPTPTESAELSWTYDAKGDQGYVAMSDPLIVHGDIYLVVSGELRVIDASTGKVKMVDDRELKTSVGSTSAYFNRPVYTGGLIVVPSDGGSLTAFTADTLTCVWKTDALEVSDGSYQTLSSLTANGSYVYAGFTVVGAGDICDRGTLVCVDITDGHVVWTRDDVAQDDSSMGYYWAGAAVSGNDIIIGDDAGSVRLIDGTTGDVKASVNVGSSVRAGIVPAGENTFLAVSRDGVLHKIALSEGVLTEQGSVAFAMMSTSTPTAANGKAFVCGADEDGYGTLSVIDLTTMALDHTVRGDKGESKSAPLVSVQADGVYAYFTCNNTPGRMYGYHVGDGEAYALYTPEGQQQNWCTASVIADERGNLYYTNDSGTLFAFAGKPGFQVTFEVNGGSYVSSRFVAAGSVLVQPDDPTREGYTFGGWYEDEALTQAWDFSAPIVQTITLYAKWVSRGTDGNDDHGDGDYLGTNSALTTGTGTGTVTPSRVPLASGATSSGEGEGDTETVTSSPEKYSSSDDVKPKDSQNAVTTDADDPGSPSSLPWWAVVGLVVGAAGLTGALWYLLGRNRRKGEA